MRLADSVSVEARNPGAEADSLFVQHIETFVKCIVMIRAGSRSINIDSSEISKRSAILSGSWQAGSGWAGFFTQETMLARSTGAVKG